MTSRILRTATAAAVAIVSATLLAGCGDASGPAATDTPAEGGTVTWGVSIEPDCYDPHASSQQNAFPIIRNYAESLIGKQLDGSYVPWLAESWEISDDETVYTFHLRDDVTFSDGTRLDAEIVKTNYDAITAEDSTLSGKTSLSSYASSRVVDDHTIEMTLTEPDAAFLDAASDVWTSILAPAAFDQGGDHCRADDPTLITTGPFVIDEWIPGQSVSFSARDDYDWAPGYAAHTGRAHVDEAVYRFLPEATVRTGALTADQVDVIENVQVTDTQVFEDVPGFQYLRGPSTGTAFSLNVNINHAPADDVRVRQALRDGVDLDAIVRGQYLGTVERAYSSLGPDNEYFDEDLVGAWGNDVDGANALLDEAGWTGRDAQGYRTKDGERLTIEVGYPEPYVRDERDILLQAIQSSLRDDIGMDLDLQIITAAQYSDENAKGTWSIYPNTLQTADPTTMFRSLFTSAGFLYLDDPDATGDLDDLVEESKRSTDPAARKAVFDEIQESVVSDARYIPLFHPVYTIAASDRVGGLGFEAKTNGPASSYDVWVAE
ncbi:ABC transporter substrate-binding protein [Microbacterium gubbeenense]|uniref:ABC transporter substrate-binding protein n=1 Tax=Microbacterium gubbeenense TaxID=159896 RepID=UPI003F9E740F